MRPVLIEIEGIKSWLRHIFGVLFAAVLIITVPMSYIMIAPSEVLKASDTAQEIGKASEPQVNDLKKQNTAEEVDLQKKAPKPAAAPFSTAQARQFQLAWAKYLRLPVEYQNSTGMKFRLIPPGEFQMGATPGEQLAAMRKVNYTDKNQINRIESECPQHKVILTRPMYMGICEVTQSQYLKVIGENPSRFSREGKSAGFVAESNPELETSEYPVESVAWADAVKFCRELSRMEQERKPQQTGGKKLELNNYRLPTEAEWEFACRAGTTTVYWMGDKPESLRAVSHSHSERATQKVGQLKANPFGLFDVYGNVNEWCSDWWEVPYYQSFLTEPAVDPRGAGRNASGWKTYRGGGLYDNATECRSASRQSVAPAFESSTIGFRVVLEIGPPAAVSEP